MRRKRKEENDEIAIQQIYDKINHFVYAASVNFKPLAIESNLAISKQATFFPTTLSDLTKWESYGNELRSELLNLCGGKMQHFHITVYLAETMAWL